MSDMILGTIQGDTIKLQHPLSLVDGQQVEVIVRLVGEPSNWGDGLKRCAGSLADMPELDGIMDDIYRQRKIERHGLVE